MYRKPENKQKNETKHITRKAKVHRLPSIPKHGAKCYAQWYPVTESDHSHVSGNSMRTVTGSFELPPLDAFSGTEDPFRKGTDSCQWSLTMISTDINV